MKSEATTLLWLLRERYIGCAVELVEDQLLGVLTLTIRRGNRVVRADVERIFRAPSLDFLFRRIESELFPNPAPPALPRMASEQTRRSLASRAAEARRKRAWSPI